MSDMVDDELLGGEDELDGDYDITNEREEALLQEDEEYSKDRDSYHMKKEATFSDIDEDDVLNLDIEEDFQDEDKLLYDDDDDEEEEQRENKEKNAPVEKPQISNIVNVPVKTQAPPKTLSTSKNINVTQNVNNDKKPPMWNDKRRRGNGRGNFQTRPKFIKNNNNNQKRRNGTVLINPRYEGTVHISENNARLAWDNAPYPQNNSNLIQPWTSGNLLGNCETIVTNLVTGIASLAQQPSNLVLPQTQPPVQNFYQRPNYERQLSFEPPPSIPKDRPPPQTYNNRNMHVPEWDNSYSAQNQVSNQHMPPMAQQNYNYNNYGSYGRNIPQQDYPPEPQKSLNPPNLYENKNLNYNRMPPAKFTPYPNNFSPQMNYQNKNIPQGNYQNKNVPQGNYQNKTVPQGNYQNKNIPPNNYQSKNLAQTNYQNKSMGYNNENYQNRNPTYTQGNYNNYNVPTYENTNFNDMNQRSENFNLTRNFNRNQNFTYTSQFQKQPPTQLRADPRLRNPNYVAPQQMIPTNRNFEKQAVRRPMVNEASEPKDESSEKKVKMSENAITVSVNKEQNVNSSNRKPEPEEEDEETRVYRLKIEEQKREREKVLRIKEERRKQMIQQQQKQNEGKLVTNQVQQQKPKAQQVVKKIINPGTNQKSNPSGIIQRLNQYQPPPLLTSPDNISDIPVLTFKVSNDVQSSAKDVPKNEAPPNTATSASSFMSNRMIVVKNKANMQKSATLPTANAASVSNEGNSDTSDVGLSAFFNNRKVLKKDNNLLNTRLVVVNNLSANINQNKLVALSRGIGEIQTVRVDKQERQATILFKSVASAHAFFKKYQRRILDDLSVIEVKLEPML